MTEVIVRVHSVHLVNVEQRQVAADPQTKSPPDLGCESFRSGLPEEHLCSFHFLSHILSSINGAKALKGSLGFRLTHSQPKFTSR